MSRYLAKAILVTVAISIVVAVPRAWAADPEFDAEVRAREYVLLNNDFDGDVDDPNNYAVLRTRVGMNFEAGDHASAYVQFQDTRSFGEPANTLTSLEQIDLHQGYLNVSEAFTPALSLRIGRQEMRYGRERQISASGWTDVGRAFDGLRAMYDIEDFGFVDIIAMKTAETGGISTIQSGANITAGGAESALLGVYVQYDVNEELDIEGYVLDVYRDGGDVFATNGDVLEDSNTGNLFTAGARFEFAAEEFTVYGEGALQFGESPGQRGMVDGVEAVVSTDYAGFAAYGGADYYLPAEVESWLGVEVNYATGDDPETGDEFEGYVPLFPAIHAPLGAMDFVGWSNVLGIRGRAGVKPTEQWKLWFDYHMFQLVETADTWYGAGGFFDPMGGARMLSDGTAMAYVGGEDFDSALGQELDVTVEYMVDENLRFEFQLGYWMPGDWQNQATAATANALLGEAGSPDFDPSFDAVANAADLDAAFNFWMSATGSF